MFYIIFEANIFEMKKNIGSILFLVVIFLLLFVPSFKALVIKGFLATGLFNSKIQPKTEQVHIINTVNGNVTFLNNQNQTISLSSLKGKVVFINFWATWCAPCLAEMPNLNELYHQFKDNTHIVFITVEMDGNKEGAQKLFATKQWNLPLYYPQSSLPEQLYTGSLPTTVVIDKTGNIVFKKEGFAQYHNATFIQQLNELAR